MTTSTFTRPSTKGVPKPFRPGDYADCAALVLEPKSKQMAKMDGKRRLEIVADLHIFDEPSDIEKGKPSETIEMVMTWGRIGSLLNRALVDGRMVAARVAQDKPHPEYGTRPWTLKDLTPEIEEKLATWATNRG